MPKAKPMKTKIQSLPVALIDQVVRQQERINALTTKLSDRRNKSMAMKNTKSAKQNRRGRFAGARDSALPMWLVMMRDGKDDKWRPCAAYATRIQAQVYASGCSDPERIKIVAGAFAPN